MEFLAARSFSRGSGAPRMNNNHRWYTARVAELIFSGASSTQSRTVVGKKYLAFSSRARTLQYQFSESNEPFLDRLDIFSDATDLKNTLVLLFLRHLPPQSQIN